MSGLVEYHKQIAKIESTHLGYEDHGIFSLNISFSYGSSAQGTGHYCICGNEPSPGDANGTRLVKAIIDACGVDEWSKLRGRTVYALRDSDDFHAMVVGIEPLPTEKGERAIFKEILAA